MALLEVKDLVVHYGKALALDGIDLRVEPGELVAVLGPNGAGKSTLLKAISRAVPMSRGHIVFRDKPLDPLPAHKVVAEGICHCPEGRHLFPELTVLKNLQLGAYLRRDKPAIAADLERVYELFPVLRQRSRQQASTLSGGEQQMVAIGRALMGRPALLLLDEPSVGIAHRLKVQIFESIRQIQRAGTAVLLVEQDALSALSVASRVYLLEHGRMAREGTSDALAHDDYIRQVYLGV
ncbi:MAG TPA: ABC transporter ATP-binding protein [Stellaceae bacterium]|nr:ABC transporter ATP-binding protein [Stellaceae bacterium]